MHTLDETIDVAGEWWPADKPESSVSGQLHFNKEGVELLLNQAFDPPQGMIRTGDAIPHYSAVHGITVMGEAVTLIDAWQAGTSMNFNSGGIRQPGIINTHFLVFGAHLPADFHFPKISFRVPGLQAWLGQKLIDRKNELSEDRKYRKQSYDLKMVPEEKFHIPSIDATASYYYGWNSSVNEFSSISVDISAWLSFEPGEPREINWYLEQQERFLTMVSFLSGCSMFADAIHARLDDSKNRVDILLNMRGVDVSEERGSPHNFFLSHPVISVPLETYCNKWFDLAPQADKPISLARSVMASEGVWLHMEFLSLMQALEGLHRALFDGNYMEDNQYESVKKVMSESIPKTVTRDHHAALKSRIRYGNQISLRKRLNELAKKLSSQVRFHIFGNDGKVPSSWIDTRNYYTHWDEDLRPDILDTQSMNYANIRMHYFLRTIYMMLMGIESSDVERALIGTSKGAQRLIQINLIEKRKKDPNFTPQAIMTISDGGSNKNTDKSKTK